ncbi:MAG TPA: hypothetical protein VF365_13465 [Candidatus Limnocylindria bacterium]
MRLILLVGVLVAGALAGLAVQRGSGTTVVVDEAAGGPIVECSGWTGVTDGCGRWGVRIVAAGAPTMTFEFEDVVRVRLDRPMLGLSSTCVAEYFLARYPDDVAWTEEVDCPAG